MTATRQTPAGPGDRARGAIKGEMGSDFRSIGTLLTAAALGVAAQVLFAYALTSGGPSVFAVSMVVAGAALVVGGLIGFLFGIPRSLQQDAGVTDTTAGAGSRGSRAGYGANTNLEQVSDWLTKIIVGVGLTQLANAPDAFANLGAALKPGLGGTPASPTFGVALVLFYWTVGFLLAYVWTRINFGRALAQADQLLDAVDAAVNDRLQETTDTNRALQVLIDQQLSASAKEVDPAALLAAIKGVSADRRLDVFTTTNAIRDDNWRDEAKKPLMERTEAIFRALVDSREDPWMAHRYHATLGYVLKDKRQPDWAGAEAMLSRAIELRDEHEQRGWAVYEMNRALARITLGRPDADVLADLKVAKNDANTYAKLTAADPSPLSAKSMVDPWLAAHNLTLDQV